jgi:hypothetical protein
VISIMLRRSLFLAIALAVLLQAGANQVRGQAIRKFVETVRLGTDINDTTYLEPTVGAVLPDGGVVVGNIGRTEIRFNIYDAKGQLRHTFGRKGKGPGEFATISTIGVIRDSLWIGDGTLGRITLFGKDGSLGRTIPVPAGGYPVLLLDGTSSVIAHLPYTGLDDPLAWPSMMKKAGPPIPARVVHVNAKGDSIGAFVAGQFRPRVRDHARKSGQYSAGPQPWDDALLVAGYPSGNGVVAVDRTVDTKNPHYTVTRFDGNGKVVFQTKMRYQPRRVTDEDIATVDDLARASEDLHPPGNELQRIERAHMHHKMKQSLWIPPHMTSVSAIVPGGDGTLWIGRDEEKGERKWGLLSSSGKAQYEIVLAGSARVLAGDANHLWYTFTADEGRQILVGGRFQ